MICRGNASVVYKPGNLITGCLAFHCSILYMFNQTFSVHNCDLHYKYSVNNYSKNRWTGTHCET